MSPITFLLVAAAITLALSVVATILVVKSEGFDRSQKRNQLLLTWFLPFVGGTIVTVFHCTNEPDPRDEGDNGSDMTDEQLHATVWPGADNR